MQGALLAQPGAYQDTELMRSYLSVSFLNQAVWLLSHQELVTSLI